MKREEASQELKFGDAMPSFNLPAAAGGEVDNSYFQDAKAALVVFSCNHCPYVKGSEEILIGIVKKYQSEGLKAVTINSNDSVKYPDDSFENMQKKAEQLGLPYPYLHDETQQVAKAFDAACTPECYLFDAEGKLVYHGAINNSPKDPAAASVDSLSPAIEAVLAGGAPAEQYVHPVGCSIKWV